MQSTVKVACLALLLLGFVSPAPVQSQQDRHALHTSVIPMLADGGAKPGSGGG